MLTLVGGFAAAAGARRSVVLRVVDRILYAARAALHDGLPGQRHSSKLVDGYVYILYTEELTPENNQFLTVRRGHQVARYCDRAVSPPESLPYADVTIDTCPF